jgi:hypothetical protein
MSASSVRSKFIEVEKEKKRQTRLKEAGVVVAPVKEEAPKPVEPVRARNEDGTLKSDDKSTPNVNEAWVGGKAPKKKASSKKKKS